MPKITLGTVTGTDRPSTGTTLSNGNLTAIVTAAATRTFRCINASSGVNSTYMFRKTGQWWIEATVVTIGGGTPSTASPIIAVGATNQAPTGSVTHASNLSIKPNGGGWQPYQGVSTSGATIASFTAGNTYTIGIVVDIDAEVGRVYVDGVGSAEISMATPWDPATGVTPGITMLILNEQVTMNFGYDANGAYTPATHLAAYLAHYPKALPWQDEKFHPTVRPVISPRPVAHIRL